MKTTLNLNDAIVAKAKTLAIKQGTSLTRLIEEGLQLRMRAQQFPAETVRLPVFHGKGGLRHGIDGTSNKAMRDAADEEE